MIVYTNAVYDNVPHWAQLQITHLRKYAESIGCEFDYMKQGDADVETLRSRLKAFGVEWDWVFKIHCKMLVYTRLLKSSHDDFAFIDLDTVFLDPSFDISKLPYHGGLAVNSCGVDSSNLHPWQKTKYDCARQYESWIGALTDRFLDTSYYRSDRKTSEILVESGYSLNPWLSDGLYKWVQRDPSRTQCLIDECFYEALQAMGVLTVTYPHLGGGFRFFEDYLRKLAACYKLKNCGGNADHAFQELRDIKMLHMNGRHKDLIPIFHSENRIKIF